MNINFSYLNNVNYSMNQRQDMLHALINKKSAFGSHGRDTFTKSADVPNSLGMYSPFLKEKDSYISDLLLLVINNQCHLDSVFYNENSISYSVMH